MIDGIYITNIVVIGRNANEDNIVQKIRKNFF